MRVCHANNTCDAIYSLYTFGLSMYLWLWTRMLMLCPPPPSTRVWLWLLWVFRCHTVWGMQAENAYSIIRPRPMKWLMFNLFIPLAVNNTRYNIINLQFMNENISFNWIFQPTTNVHFILQQMKKMYRNWTKEWFMIYFLTCAHSFSTLYRNERYPSLSV